VQTTGIMLFFCALGNLKYMEKRCRATLRATAFA
jgi:hypothetical protein